jgi:hypothetical protein
VAAKFVRRKESLLATGNQTGRDELRRARERQPQVAKNARRRDPLRLTSPPLSASSGVGRKPVGNWRGKKRLLSLAFLWGIFRKEERVSHSKIPAAEAWLVVGLITDAAVCIDRRGNS